MNYTAGKSHHFTPELKILHGTHLSWSKSQSHCDGLQSPLWACPCHPLPPLTLPQPHGPRCSRTCRAFPLLFPLPECSSLRHPQVSRPPPSPLCLHATLQGQAHATPPLPGRCPSLNSFALLHLRPPDLLPTLLLKVALTVCLLLACGLPKG